MKRLALAVLFALGCGAPVAAAPFYDNLAYGSGGGDAIATVGPIANSFSTTALDFTVSYVKLSLLRNLEDSETISVKLLSNGAGDTPGSTVFLQDFITTDTLAATPSTVTVSFNPITLLPSTRYWISLESISGAAGSGLWEAADSASGIGVLGEFWTNAAFGSSVPNSDGQTPYVMAVGLTVPEPLTLSLFGAGLIGAAILYRRRRAR